MNENELRRMRKAELIQEYIELQKINNERGHTLTTQYADLRLFNQYKQSFWFHLNIFFTSATSGFIFRFWKKLVAIRRWIKGTGIIS